MGSDDAVALLVRNMPVGFTVWQLDADSSSLRLLYANAAADALAGVALSESLGLTMPELFPDLPSERQLHYVKLAAESALGPVVRAGDVRTKTTTLSVRALPMPDRCVGIIFQDLAEQTGELAKREERFRALIQNSDDAVVVVNSEARPVFASESLRHVLGYEPSSFLGIDAFSLLHADDRERTRASFGAVVAQAGSRITVEVRVAHANGTWREIEATIVNHLQNPNVAGLVCNFRDVTERKQNQESLRVTQEQLFQARKMEAIGRLAGGIAHDFNNLLSVVLSYAEILLAEQSSAQNQELNEIRRAALRAGELTRRLLAFSRQQVLAPRVINLNTALVSIEDMLGRVVGTTVELHLALAPDLWNTRIDPAQVEQVVLNLVINARDAMPSGGHLKIKTSNEHLDADFTTLNAGFNPGAYVLLAVTDTGSGMDKATIARIFEPFFTTKGLERGTGLGLSIVFGIVQQSEGHIRVFSEPGLGTTFELYLPRATGRTSSRPSIAPAEPATGGTARILLVEDDDAVRAVIKAISTKLGYQVTDTHSGPAALILVATGATFDLLLTDVAMPEMTGWELALRVHATRPGFKLLLISGHTSDLMIRNGIIDQEVEFLEKPISPDALANKVRLALNAPDFDPVKH